MVGILTFFPILPRPQILSLDTLLRYLLNRVCYGSAGADNIGDSQPVRSARQVDPLVVLNQPVPLTNMAYRGSPNRSVS